MSDEYITFNTSLHIKKEDMKMLEYLVKSLSLINNDVGFSDDDSTHELIAKYINYCINSNVHLMHNVKEKLASTFDSFDFSNIDTILFDELGKKEDVDVIKKRLLCAVVVQTFNSEINVNKYSNVLVELAHHLVEHGVLKSKS